MGIKIGKEHIGKLYTGSTQINSVAAGNTEFIVEPDYLCITPEETGYFVLGTTGMTINELYYRIDNGEWQEYELGALTNISAGQKLYFKGNNSTFSTDTDYIQFSCFTSTGQSNKFTCSGNIMSLLDETCQSKVIPSDYCFYKLFAPFEFDEETTIPCGITSAPKLPATTLANNCYNTMFYECTSLTSAPELPATTLANSCYIQMFQGCTSLTAVPELPATTLAENCYRNMFVTCTSLYVSDTQTSEASHEWKIPATGTFTNTTTYNQSGMFTNCLGTRSSNNMSGAFGESHTYYTQNEPV